MDVKLQRAHSSALAWPGLVGAWVHGLVFQMLPHRLDCVPWMCDNSDEGMSLCGLLSALAGIGTGGVDRGWHHTPFLS